MVLVLCNWARSSGSGRLLALVRSMVGGNVVGSVRSVSVIQAKRSKTQRTEPAKELITSKTALAILCKYVKRAGNLGLLMEIFCHCPDRFVAQ